MDFKPCSDFNSFFSILPLDWRECILPFWKDYKDTTECYVLREGDAIVAGGLVFSKCPPDMLYAQQEANAFFKAGYQYLGFIYVIESKQGQSLGSMWLNSLKLTYPNVKYWLTIEDSNLHAFYIKNGFRYAMSLFHNDEEERVYVSL